MNDDPRVPLAIERTLLAWTRTGLALMGFGFLISKVGSVIDAGPTGEIILRAPAHLPTITGALFIAAGAAVNIAATIQHKSDTATPSLKLSAALSLFTGLLGGVLSIYVAFF